MSVFAELLGASPVMTEVMVTWAAAGRGSAAVRTSAVRASDPARKALRTAVIEDSFWSVDKMASVPDNATQVPAVKNIAKDMHHHGIQAGRLSRRFLPGFRCC